MPDFNSPDDVKKWLEANGGVEGLRRAVEKGRFANRNKVDAEAWLRAHDRQQVANAEQAELELAERGIRAAETAAHAAAESAKWAKWAAGISVVAAIASVAQYLAAK